MEVDAQLLVGAAITVFLALLFFGVVVLWDVALALRSVGDKIDKLEDTVDDDLTEIGHTMDRSAGTSSGGGTQLHLNGGTISSGPSASQPRQAAADRGPEYGPHPEHSTAEGDPAARGSTERPQTPDPGPSPADDGAEADAAAESAEPADETASATDGAEGRDEDDAAPEEDEPDAEDVEEADEEGTEPDDASGSEPEPTDEPDAASGDEANAVETHPRAAASRGRFVTSPDRTAWYATTLDRGAIAEARSPIAGELTDGSEPEYDESDVIAAGPVDPNGAAGRADDGAAVAAPSGNAGTDDPVDGLALGPTPDDASAASRPGEDPSADDADTDGGAVVSFEDETEPEAPADAGPELDADAAASPDGRPGGEVADTDRRDEGVEESAPEPSARPTDPLADFEVPEPDEADDLTVEEAVDEMREDPPVPELSSHAFDVTAEVDDDGAVVVLEFDPDAVELTGSTKRLLQYQLRSFAEQEATPDGDVTIGRHRIVVDVPGSDGNVVTRWSEAAVTIVDRTLYLSDNSS